MGPPCQVPYNTLLWGKNAPSNMTGVGVGGAANHTIADTRYRVQISKMSQQSICNHLSCHSDWLVSNILLIYMLI